MNDSITQHVDLNEQIYDDVKKILCSKKEELNNIKNVCLTHTDIWDGNILIDHGKLSGIVDFSDLYYCDELMTFYFHTIDGVTRKQFLKGYGKQKLSHDETVRINIYRLYVILKMIIECKIKDYGRFEWMYENLDNRIKILQRIR